ncbi:hypothetical protein BGZ76_002314 [Entomortierella beljakovae]|nr:hypothetical protein BGZ76_002314 [Entomortierella beljakovae]
MDLKSLAQGFFVKFNLKTKSPAHNSLSSAYDKDHNLNPKMGLQRDRDHSAGQNMAGTALKWVLACD